MADRITAVLLALLVACSPPETDIDSLSQRVEGLEALEDRVAALEDRIDAQVQQDVSARSLQEAESLDLDDDVAALPTLGPGVDLLIEAEEALGSSPFYRPNGGIDVVGEGDVVTVSLAGEARAATSDLRSFLLRLGFPEGDLDLDQDGVATALDYQAEWVLAESTFSIEIRPIS